MSEIVGSLFWLIVIGVWIFVSLKQEKEKQKKLKPAGKKDEEGVREWLGVSADGIPGQIHQPEQTPRVKKKKPPQPGIERPQKEKYSTQELDLAPAEKKPQLIKKPYAREGVSLNKDLPPEKLEEGMILSTILGPPKAYSR